MWDLDDESHLSSIVIGVGDPISIFHNGETVAMGEVVYPIAHRGRRISSRV
jgi:hypothetical protein